MNNSITTNARKYTWSPLMDVRNEMDRLFDDFWGLPIDTQASARTWQPACDVTEDQDHYLLSLEIPGIPKDQIKLEVYDQNLIISGERNHEETKKEKGVRYTERYYGKFQRTFALPAGLDLDKIEANCQDGVLRIIVPKTATAKPRQIKIGAENPTSFFGRILGQSSTKEKEIEYSTSNDKKVVS